MASSSQTTVDHCTFCDLIRGAAEVSICHEDADSIAFMDIQPVNPGHVLVVSRAHFEAITDIPNDLALHLFEVTMRLSKAVRKVSGTDDMNIVLSSGDAAGQDEPHYHVHIIPRHKGDGFDIPLPFNGSEMPDRTLLDAMAARIITALRDPMRADSDATGVSDASIKPVERERSVPTYTDRSEKPAHGVQQPKTWRGREGAHGELIKGDEPDAEAG